MTAKTQQAVNDAAAACVRVCRESWTEAGATKRCAEIIGTLANNIEADATPAPAPDPGEKGGGDAA